MLAAGCAGGDGPGSGTARSGPRAPENDAERQELSFLIGMTPHHAQAVDMARLCQTRAEDDGLRATCNAIIDVQTRQIEQMMRWALQWYGTQLSEVQSARYSAEGASGSHGILTDEDMHELASRTGTAFDIRFAELMIEHHIGAVSSAQGLLDVSPHTEVRQLAADIITAQEAEIAEMENWRDDWSAMATSTASPSG